MTYILTFSFFCSVYFKLSKYIFWFSLSLAISLNIVNARYLLKDKEPGVHLDYECASLRSTPKEGAPVIMLHGLTDSKETWYGLYQNIVFLTRRRVCIYDARNHGDSGWNDTFNVDALVEDLGNFMRDRNIAKATLVGHRMGGLTAMKFALQNPDKVESLFVEDISPVGIPAAASLAVGFYLNLLNDSISAIPEDADEEGAKKAVLDYIREATSEPEFNVIYKKLPFRCRNGVWQWKANFNVFIKTFEDPDSFLGKVEGKYEGKIFFIYGEASWFKVADDKEAIRKLFPKAEFYGIEGAGHVIHSQYYEFLRQLIKFLK